MEITKQILIDEFLTKFIKSGCSRCGSHDFNIMVAPGGELAQIPHNVLSNNMDAIGVIPCYSTVCTNCGHLDFYGRKFVEDRINESIKTQEKIDEV